MVKADLAGMVSGLGGLASGEAEAIVDAIFETMIAAIQSGDKIEIRGFGSFRIRQRNPRIGRNPSVLSHIIIYNEPRLFYARLCSPRRLRSL